MDICENISLSELECVTGGDQIPPAYQCAKTVGQSVTDPPTGQSGYQAAVDALRGPACAGVSLPDLAQIASNAAKHPNTQH
jgi:hypothetical protein